MAKSIRLWAHYLLAKTKLLAWVSSLAIAITAMAPGAFADTELVIEHRLPLQTALEAATTAITTCQKQGAAVSASVVDQHGLQILGLKGDGSAPHTMKLSNQKAYTAAALAPLQGVMSTSEVATKLHTANQAIGKLSIPSEPIDGIIVIPGGMIIRTENGEVIGAIGVSGASSGSQDEQCASAGIISIRHTLQQVGKS
jgi:uncharacterized protein GlcG (DUF336 family)